MDRLRNTLDRKHAGRRPIVFVPPTVRQVKVLIWIYFWLIIFEGALRKWVFPGLSDVLLVVRDPVALLIYIQAIRGGFFPRNFLVKVMVGLGTVTFFWGLVQAFGETAMRMVVAAYGVRTFFFHLPLIFIIGHVFDSRDVVKMGRWFLYISIPMAFLMILQYQASPDSFLNRGTAAKEEGEAGGQLLAALGRVRPAGTFSFISGPGMFYPLVTVFLLLGMVRPRTYPVWLLLSAAACTIVVLPVSGSRSLVLSCALVCASMVVAGFFNPKVMPRIIVFGILLFVLGLGVLATPVGREGVESFATRWEQANSSEGRGRGDVAAISNRFFGGFTEIFGMIDQVPFGGLGIGVGTNVGSKLLTGGLQFLAGENEWTRIVLEGGIFLGFSYILFRICLAATLLVEALAQMRQGRFLPWLLISISFTYLVMGQTQQPTILGMMVLMAGLSQASLVRNVQSPVPMKKARRPSMIRD